MFAEHLNSIVNYDIKVTNAYKSYGTNNCILNGFNMKVASGSIYGLLGPSGCGKSTLFQCILGKIALDSGNIEFNVQRLNDIGYMPQDLCLNGELTIKETFEYYGSLYAMRKTNIAKRINELTTFLKLPDSNRLIGNLSGGQSRRVSLAICILHDPKIILMDEPTVGIDTLIREEIWIELTNMAEQHKKTIIVTTHYIEEASQANCIGLMRNGVLVEEGPPKYNTDSLETAFLKLCSYQNENRTVHAGTSVRVSHHNTSQTKKLKMLENRLNIHRVNAQIKKYVKLFKRDYLLLTMMLVFPITQTFFFCNSIGTDFRNMTVAIKNDEIDFRGSRQSNIDGCIYDGKSDQKISGIVMNRLESLGYTLEEVADRNAGGTIIRNNSKYIAFIHFPKNYTEAFTKHIEDSQNYYYNSQVYVDLDKHNLLFKNKIVFDIKDTLDHITETILSGCSNNTNTIKTNSLLLVRTVEYLFSIQNFVVTVGKDVKTYTSSIAALFIALLIFSLTSNFSVSIMLPERLDGILQRSMFAGLKISELVFSLFFISNMILITQMIVPLIIVYVWYGNPIQVTSGLVAYNVLMLFLGWTGFFFGIIAACVSPNSQSAFNAVNAFNFVLCLLSGFVWLVESQPPLLQMVTEFLPTRRSGIILTNIALKGWTLDHPLVIRNVVVMFFYNVILVLILIGLGKFKKNMWSIK